MSTFLGAPTTRKMNADMQKMEARWINRMELQEKEIRELKEAADQGFQGGLRDPQENSRQLPTLNEAIAEIKKISLQTKRERQVDDKSP